MNVLKKEDLKLTINEKLGEIGFKNFWYQIHWNKHELYSIDENIIFPNFDVNISKLRIILPKKVTLVFVVARFNLYIVLSQN